MLNQRKAIRAVTNDIAPDLYNRRDRRTSVEDDFFSITRDMDDMNSGFMQRHSATHIALTVLLADTDPDRLDTKRKSKRFARKAVKNAIKRAPNVPLSDNDTYNWLWDAYKRYAAEIVHETGRHDECAFHLRDRALAVAVVKEQQNIAAG